jgi:hypothetical protein
MQYLQPNLQIIIIAALACVALLIIGLIIFKLVNRKVRGRRGSRLGISEYHEIDKTRRLVLVRRDGTEHLLLIGGQQDLVVESGIDSGINSTESLPVNEPIPMRVPPRPAVFGNRRPPLRPVAPSFMEDENNDQAS